MHVSLDEFKFRPDTITNPRVRGRGGLVVNTSDSGFRGRGFEPPLGSPCCVLEQDIYTPKNTTQEAVAPSQHD